MMASGSSGLLPTPSDEQAAVRDIVLAGHNVVVEAVVGAGKSTCSIVAAKALKQQFLDSGSGDRGRALLLCFNTELKNDCESRIARLGLTDTVDCFTLHGLCGHLFNTTVPDANTMQKLVAQYRHAPQDLSSGVKQCSYDICFLDEAQDLSEDIMLVLQVLFAQNDTNMQFVVLGDDRQRIYDFSRVCPIDLLRHPGKWLPCNYRKWKSSTLLQSFRLTETMCTFINTLFPPPQKHMSQIIPGNFQQPVHPVRVVIGDAASGHLVQTVLQLVREFSISDIMILFPSVRSQMCQDFRLKLSATHRIPVYCTTQNSSSGEEFKILTAGKITVSSFHQAKGRERDCVLVCGIGGDYADRWQSDPNPLHVALTRARKKLVVWLQYNEARLPPLADNNALERVSELVCLCPGAPRQLMPRMQRQVRTIYSRKLVTFVRDDFLRRMSAVVKVSKPRPGLGQECTIIPRSEVDGESVRNIYRPAMLAAFEYIRTQKSAMMDWLRKSNQLFKLPGACVAEIQRAVQAHTQHEPISTEIWMTAALAFVALETGNVHVPHQLKNLRWMSPNDITFFSTCVNNLLALTRQHAYAQHNQEFQRSTPQPNSVLLKTHIDLVSRPSGDVSHTPPSAWILSLDTAVLESHMWEAATIMWTLQVPHVFVFLIAKNELYRVKVDDLEVLHVLMTDMIAAQSS